MLDAEFEHEHEREQERKTSELDVGRWTLDVERLPLLSDI
jgi:hypothetical protein